MKKIKELFATPKKAALFACCVVAILALIAVLASFAVGAIAQSSSIGEENAKKIALADVGIDPASGVQPRAKFDFEDGHFVYEVEFTADGSEYEYWIKASDGSVIKKDVEFVDSSGNSVKVSASITVDEAKEAALADAGRRPSEVLKFVKEKLDYDDGVSVYDIKFYTGDTEYEYEIDAATGDVLSRDVEPIKSGSVGGNAGNGSSDNPGMSESGDIGVDRAKITALADANVSAENATFTKAERDFDNGKTVYDIEFYTGDTEYEYEIDAATGDVLSRDVEPIKSGSTGGNGGSGSSYISVEQAKAAALVHAGFSASDVTFSKAKLDRDDGRVVYEIEFYRGRAEYEYKIDAVNGNVLEHERND